MAAFKRGKSKGARFTAIYEWEMNLPAYRHLSVYGRSLLIEFRIIYTPLPCNNGKIGMSVRRAAKLLGCGKNKAAETLLELQKLGWIVCTTKGAFTHKTEKMASTWRITNQPIDLGVVTPATKEYTKWKPVDKIIHGPSGGTVCPFTRDHKPKRGTSTKDQATESVPQQGTAIK